MDVLDGIRVVEVAQWGFVPSAAAVLSDWGADVVKVEHPSGGDPMRGLTVAGIAPGTAGFSMMWEVCNRGKRSVGIDVSEPEGRELVLRLVERADVFVTSLLPGARSALGIDVDDVMARNPGIVYGRGSGHGARGPDAEKGGFDAISFWSRGGPAYAITPPDDPAPIRMPAPAFGDVISGMTFAGSIAAALVRRERTGEGAVVDVSLLATAMWAMQPSIVGAAMLDVDNIEWPPPPNRPGNPLAHAYRTADDRFVALNFLQPDRYWQGFCEAVGRPDLLSDPKLATAKDRAANVEHAVRVLAELFGGRTLEDWEQVLATQEGQWDVVRTPREVSEDPQAIANGYVQPVEYDGGRSISLVAAPGQFGDEPTKLRPAPELGEATDATLADLGLDWEKIIDLKLRNIVH